MPLKELLIPRRLPPGPRVARPEDRLRSRLEGRTLLLQCIVALLSLGTSCSLPGNASQAGGTLVVGMTAGDLPITTGNPDQGFEGYRFVGYNLYDSLVLWDLSESDRRPPTSSQDWRPSGISTRPIPSAGSSNCVRASNGMTAATSRPMMWSGI